MSNEVQNRKKNKKKDIDIFKIKDIYKYDVEDEIKTKLNKIIDKHKEDNNKKTLSEIIKENNELTKNEKLELKNI